MKTLARGVYLIDHWEGPRFQVRVRIGKSNKFQQVTLHSEGEVRAWLLLHHPESLANTKELEVLQDPG